MDPTTNSFFSAVGGPTGLTAGLSELEALRQTLYGPDRKNRTIIPQTGAAPYFYVDPRAQQRAVLPDTQRQPEGIGLLPPNAQNILLRNALGNAPRLADDRSDLNDLLNQSPETQFLAPKPKPTPTPTPLPATKLYPTSFFT